VAAPRADPVAAGGISQHGHFVVTRRGEEGARLAGFVDRAELELGEGARVAWADYRDLAPGLGGRGGYGGCHGWRFVLLLLGYCLVDVCGRRFGTHYAPFPFVD
jgi:hypothetical protein